MIYYQEKITDLLNRLKELIGAYELFDGELRLVIDKWADKDWMSKSKELIEECNLFFGEIKKNDIPFSRFCIKMADEKLSRSTSSLLDEYSNAMSPFDGYFNTLTDLQYSLKHIDWLRKKYRPITAAEARTKGANGHFGDFCFILAVNGVPQGVSYKGSELNITGLRLRFFHAVMSKCYYNKKNDIAIAEISDALSDNIHERDSIQIRKYQNEVNKIIHEFIGIERYIVASGKNRPNCLKLSKNI